MATILQITASDSSRISLQIAFAKWQKTAVTLSKRAANKNKFAATVSVLGKKAYSTIKDLCLPDLLSEKTCEQIKEILR